MGVRDDFEIFLYFSFVVWADFEFFNDELLLLATVSPLLAEADPSNFRKSMLFLFFLHNWHFLLPFVQLGNNIIQWHRGK